MSNVLVDIETGEVLRPEESAEIATKLTEREAVIERGLTTFIEVGQALMEIRDQRLYCQQYGTFEKYCNERWGIKHSRAYQLIDAAVVSLNLSTIVDILPANEAQIRPLASLEPDDQRVVWQAALDTAPSGKITAAHVQETVNEFVSKQKPKINRAGDKYVPQGHDACQTPPYAIDPLLPYLMQFGSIWEPACGEGLLVEALYDAGFSQSAVIPTDLIEGINFFEYEPPEWDCLVTNPPYSIKYNWIERCYTLGKPFALLMPVETLGAKTSQEFFRRYGIQVIFLDKRVNFKMPNIGWEGSSAQFPVAWFTWGMSLPSDMVFARIKPDGATD